MDSQHLSVCEQVVQRIELVPVALIGTQYDGLQWIISRPVYMSAGLFTSSFRQGNVRTVYLYVLFLLSRSVSIAIGTTASAITGQVISNSSILRHWKW